MTKRRLRAAPAVENPDIDCSGQKNASVSTTAGHGVAVFVRDKERFDMRQADSLVDVRVKGRWIAVPVLRVNEVEIIGTGTWLRTARVRGEEMMEQELASPDLLCTAITSDPDVRLRADIFSFTQKLPNTQPLYSYPMEWESVAAIQLHEFDNWWTALPQETRKNVRRSAKRGVSVRISPFDDDLIDGIRSVNDDAPFRQGTRNAYYGQSFDDARKRYGEFIGRCDFICAYYEGEMIGFLHLVYRGDIAAILNLTVKPSHSDKRPANALMAKAVEVCTSRDLSHISYGLYNYGNKQDSPLRTFKIRNGFEEILVPRYFVPLTKWGRICIALKLHRGPIGILPPFFISKYLRARTLWYDFVQGRCSSAEERPNCNRQTERSNPPAGSSIMIAVTKEGLDCSEANAYPLGRKLRK